MAVEGTKTDENGDAILISLQEPYENIVQVVSFTDEVEGEDTSCFYSKTFRWGTDGVSYSDWVELTNDNLSTLQLDPTNPFWIEYKYEQIGDCELEFLSIALEVVTDGGVICKVPQIQCCDGQTLSGSQNLVIDCCGSSWNPYDVSRAVQTYKQMSAVVSDMFGFCVKYYKTKADQRARDVVLTEYTLFDVIKSAEVKMLLPDNELPTREIQFNPMMMDFPVQFEVHIVKSAFEKVFGVGSRPEMRDYLYFEQYMNKMYEVDAIAEADDFLYSGSYWRVSLVPYQKRTAVQFPDKNIEDEVDNLISSVETELGEARNKEYDDVRKPNQYNTIGTLANDYVRRILDKKLLIKEENLYNRWTIISKYHYNLSSMTAGEETVKYRYNSGWTINDNRAFTAWFRPKYLTPVGSNILITGLSNSGGKIVVETTGLPTDPRKAINAGDYIVIDGTLSSNGIHKIESITGNDITLVTDYVDSSISGSARFYKEAANTFLVYDSDSDRLFSITQTLNWFIILADGVYYNFSLTTQGLRLDANEWYAFVINLNNGARQGSLFIYNRSENTGAINPDRTADLELAYSSTITIPQISLADDQDWKLIAAQMDVTNIRIWNTPIEEEQHEVILSQYVVNDTHLSELIDNSSPELLTLKVTNPR